jgi:2',3'-cyclic-nucleotide 2'-phosphodiesterase (5'-nucleotidase family)
MHGFIGEQNAYFMNPNFPPKIIGGSAFYRYVENIKNALSNKSDDILILDAGNFFQGHPLGIADSGKTMIEWMNKIKYDAMVPGYTDFIYGYRNLLNLSEKADFPILAANILYEKTKENVFEPYTIININDVNIGVIGIVSSHMSDKVLSKNIMGLQFISEISSLDFYTNELKKMFL